MRFTRLLPSFAAVGAMSVMFLAACSSDDNKSSGVGTTAGSAGLAGGANVVAKAGSPATNPVGSSGSAGKPATPSAGAPVVPAGAGAPSAGGPASIPVSGGAAGAPVVVTPVAGAPVVVTPVAGGPSTTSGGAPTTGGTTARPAGAGGAPPASGGAPIIVAGAGAGGATTPPANVTLDDLIGTLCDWEFKCCTTGEVKYQLGPSVKDSASCKARFVQLLRNDNRANSGFPAGDTAATALLIQLADSVDPTRVTENPDAIAKCIAQRKDLACAKATPVSTTPAHCTAGTATADDPCDLANLVKPKQAAGAPCTFALNSGATKNDIECVAGTSCLNVGDADNPNSFAACITRGVAGGYCGTDDAKCDYGFYCDANSGNCAEKPGVGATCAYKTPTAPKFGVMAIPCKDGFTCNPNTHKCVAACTNDYVCQGNDFICPAGSSCMPTTVTEANDSKTFTTCGLVSDDGGKCNTTEDCKTGLFCNGTTCEPKKNKDGACTTDDNCKPPNLYCAAGVCTTYVAVGDDCTQASGTTLNKSCDPAEAKAGCVADGNPPATGSTTIKTICSSKLLDNGKVCKGNWDCTSERCEIATATATDMTCIAGAAIGAACDDLADSATDGKTSCVAGAFCDTTTNKCRAQLEPGASCESTTNPGNADTTAHLCANEIACNSTTWTGSFMCTDTAVPVKNGGTGLLCDGGSAK